MFYTNGQSISQCGHVLPGWDGALQSPRMQHNVTSHTSFLSYRASAEGVYGNVNQKYLRLQKVFHANSGPPFRENGGDPNVTV